MTESDLVTAEDVGLMQSLAQTVVATNPELVNSDASFGELAWNWGKDHEEHGDRWRRHLIFEGGELAAWGWAFLPRAVTRSDGSVTEVNEAYLACQVRPDRPEFLDEIIDWFDGIAPDVDRKVLPGAEDHESLSRWAAHGYEVDASEMGDKGSWSQLNGRDLKNLDDPRLPDGFRFRTAGEVGPAAAAKAHVDAWHPSPFTQRKYEGVLATRSYREDLHVLLEAPDGTLVSTAIMWLDEVNRTAEFEPVGTHRAWRRQGLGSVLLRHGMLKAREAGATHMTVACRAAPGHPAARGLYYGLGFKPFSRDLPHIKPVGS